jgi:ABC-type Zn2+ transport system substrate-binding protein/surface adhesin
VDQGAQLNIQRIVEEMEATTRFIFVVSQKQKVVEKLRKISIPIQVSDDDGGDDDGDDDDDDDDDYDDDDDDHDHDRDGYLTMTRLGYSSSS